MSARDKPREHPSPTLSLATALDRCAPLTLLLERLRDARERFDTVRDLLPPGLRHDVRPGPVEQDGWTLLAEHSAAAAKLRQLLPLLQRQLQQAGWQGTSIRVKVQPRAPQA